MARIETPFDMLQEYLLHNIAEVLRQEGPEELAKVLRQIGEWSVALFPSPENVQLTDELVRQRARFVLDLLVAGQTVEPQADGELGR
jgi:hypothetical protein